MIVKTDDLPIAIDEGSDLVLGWHPQIYIGQLCCSRGARGRRVDVGRAGRGRRATHGGGSAAWGDRCPKASAGHVAPSERCRK